MLRDKQSMDIEVPVGDGIKFRVTRVGEDLVMTDLESVSADFVMISGVFFETDNVAKPWVDAVIQALEFVAGSDRPFVTVLKEPS